MCDEFHIDQKRNKKQNKKQKQIPCPNENSGGLGLKSVW